METLSFLICCALCGGGPTGKKASRNECKFAPLQVADLTIRQLTVVSAFPEVELAKHRQILTASQGERFIEAYCARGSTFAGAFMHTSLLAALERCAGQATL